MLRPFINKLSYMEGISLEPGYKLIDAFKILDKELDKNFIIIDNSKRSDFVKCHRLYYWKNVCGLKTKKGSTALRYGSTWHAIMQGYYAYIKINGWEEPEKAIEMALISGKDEWDKSSEGQEFIEDYRTFENCCQQFLLYLQYYPLDKENTKVIDTEKVFQLVIPALHKPILFTGKIDLQLEIDSMPWIEDHKSTGMNLDIIASRLHRSAQLIGYSYSADKVLNFKPIGCIVNFAYISARKSKKTGEYGEVSFDFRRCPQIYTDKDIEQWVKSIKNTAYELMTCQDVEVWPMGHDECYNQYGQCPFSVLCEQNKRLEEVNTDNFIHKPWDVRND